MPPRFDSPKFPAKPGSKGTKWKKICGGRSRIQPLTSTGGILQGAETNGNFRKLPGPAAVLSQQHAISGATHVTRIVPRGGLANFAPSFSKLLW
jgi:hypothetical protein